MKNLIKEWIKENNWLRDYRDKSFSSFKNIPETASIRDIEKSRYNYRRIGIVSSFNDISYENQLIFDF